MRSGFRSTSATRSCARTYSTPPQLAQDLRRRAGVERLYNTFLYTGLALVIQLSLGLAIALLLDTDRSGYGMLRALMTLPLVVPPAVTGMMFLPDARRIVRRLEPSALRAWILSPQYPILATVRTALAGILLAEIWQWTPFMVLIMLAGSARFPKEPFEAAAIDGASAQAFFQLTLPMIVQGHRHRGADPRHRSLPHFRLREGDDRFGGPGTATETLTSYAGTSISNGDFPYASTIALFTLDPSSSCLDHLHEGLQGRL